jgi:hypothetical protein
VDRWWLRSSVQLQTISLTLTGLGINPRRMRLRMSPTTGLSFDLIRKPSANPICSIKLCDGLTNWSMKWLSNFEMAIQFCSKEAFGLLCGRRKTEPLAIVALRAAALSRCVPEVMADLMPSR